MIPILENVFNTFDILSIHLLVCLKRAVSYIEFNSNCPSNENRDELSLDSGVIMLLLR